MTLPAAFTDRIREMLGTETDAFLASFREPARNGLRIHPGRWSAQEFLQSGLCEADPVPWCPDGFCILSQERLSRHPYYYAGLYYLQEPSAMAPAALLPVTPGDRVLDLCAAPGGKSTALAARLAGTGFLLSNDVSRSRARALVKNLEMFGASAMAVSCETPQALAEKFPEKFDKILVDAPCSGEGMFRRDPSMVTAWQRRGPAEYVPLQRSILEAAVRCLAPGGMLLYSTCTFSEEEDEGNVAWLLERETDLSLEPLPLTGGMQPGRLGLTGCARFWPHHVNGEGHFAALLRKGGKADNGRPDREAPDSRSSGAAPSLEAFLGRQPYRTVREALAGTEIGEKITKPFDGYRAYVKGTYLYAVSETALLDRSLGYLRTGLLLGEWKKDRFEPFQALAMTLTPDTFASSVSLPADDERLIRYLKGETLDITETEAKGPEGWTLVCADRFALGFAKRTGLRLKNKYHAGWRWQG